MNIENKRNAVLLTSLAGLLTTAIVVAPVLAENKAPAKAAETLKSKEAAVQPPVAKAETPAKAPAPTGKTQAVQQRQLTPQQKVLVSSVQNLQAAAKLSAQRKWPQAYTAYSNVIKSNPELGIAYGDRALTLIAMKRYKEAVADCNKAISLGKDSVDVYNRRAAAYTQMKDYTHGLEDYTRIINLQPANAAAYRDRAVCYMRKGDKKSAMRDISMAKKALGGKIADTNQQQKTSFLTVGGSKIVDLSAMPIEKFDEAIKKDPQHKPVYLVHRATVLIFQGKPQNALTDIDAVLKLTDEQLKAGGSPPRAKILQLRISALHKMGRYQDAITDCDKLLQQAPNDEQALLARAMSEFAMGKYKETIVDADKIKSNQKLLQGAQILKAKAAAKLKGGEKK